MTDPTDRPRPTPDGSARAAAAGATPRAAVVKRLSVPADGPQPTRVDVQPSQVVAAAGTAVFTAARVGWRLGRSSWRIARQLPGARIVERGARHLRSLATDEARRMLQAPQPPTDHRPASADQQRVVTYVRHSEPDSTALQSAMNELLERSVEATRADTRAYLYSTIISQLVPDEARILAALADGSRFATSDVVLKRRRGEPRVLLANASAIGRQAGLVAPDNVPTYLARLRHFGLIEFGPADDTLDVQYDIVATDAAVHRAGQSVDPHDRNSVKIVRKTLTMAAFGREFWAASDPSRAAVPPP